MKKGVKDPNQRTAFFLEIQERANQMLKKEEFMYGTSKKEPADNLGKTAYPGFGNRVNKVIAKKKDDGQPKLSFAVVGGGSGSDGNTRAKKKSRTVIL